MIDHNEPLRALARAVIAHPASSPRLQRFALDLIEATETQDADAEDVDTLAGLLASLERQAPRKEVRQ